MRVVFLDIDGVLNRHGYRPVESRGLVSWIEPELAARLAREIAAWLAAHGIAAERTAIIDDAFDMGELAARHVRCTPLAGFDEAAAAALRALF